MALSDCRYCWETPCQCGYSYRKYDKERFAKWISNIVQYRTKEDSIEILEKAKILIKENFNHVTKTPEHEED